MSRVGTILAGATVCTALACAGPPGAEPAELEGRAAARGPALPLVAGVELQPLRAQLERLRETLAYLGQPLVGDAERVAAAGPDALAEIQRALDPYCLVGVLINPESRVKVQRGPAVPALVQQGWRTFLVKVHNEAGVTAALGVGSPNAGPVFAWNEEVTIADAEIEARWMDLHMVDEQPMAPTLSGLALEYRILQVYSRDAGKREATLHFDVGQGTQDVGFRNQVPILFDAAPSVPLTLRVLDFDGAPTTARFVFRDTRGRVYPSQSKRLAPDFFFHPQIYRSDGETILLPEGTYTIDYTRGPEYLEDRRTITLSADDPKPVEVFELRRWIHLAQRGWRSGDHHVHAAGCSHYSDPTQGVGPEDMMRHILGEDLNVGCVLSWGPCWYFQKGFFDGTVHELSTPDNVMRYDVEVSGFPSDYAGHLCLLGLSEDDYPGTSRIEDWPSWDLPILKWAKQQGAVVGFAHSGWGLETQSHELPNYEIPPFGGIGANEYIVDVTHDAVDFISAVDTPWPWELNIWYHTNNAGFRTKLSGETDFPCIYGERLGLGRAYVRVDGQLTWERWLAGIDAGRSYVSDGRAHLLDFRIDGTEVGGDPGELRLEDAGRVTVAVTAAAWLDGRPRTDVRRRGLDQKPYWDVERARIGDTRRVPVEVVVNGLPVARREIEADGELHDLRFDVDVTQSSWVAVRIFASAHTNPIYVLVDDRPIRASKESVRWCLDGVERCWASKSGAWKQRFGADPGREAELEDCREAYEHARRVYRRRLEECGAD